MDKSRFSSHVSKFSYNAELTVNWLSIIAFPVTWLVFQVLKTDHLIFSWLQTWLGRRVFTYLHLYWHVYMYTLHYKYLSIIQTFAKSIMSFAIHFHILVRAKLIPTQLVIFSDSNKSWPQHGKSKLGKASASFLQLACRSQVVKRDANEKSENRSTKRLFL